VEGEHLQHRSLYRFREKSAHPILLSCVQNFSVTLANMVWSDNKVEYKVQLEHRESWAFTQARDAAKVEFYGAVKKLREELGLVFVRSAQPVSVHRFSARRAGEGQEDLRSDTMDLYEAQMQMQGSARKRLGDDDGTASEVSVAYVDAVSPPAAGAVIRNM
jgi:hypothetical protein